MPELSGVSAQAFFLQGRQIGPPPPVLLPSDLVEIIPGEDPGVMHVVEQETNRIVPNRLDRHDANMTTSEDCRALRRSVTLNLGAGTLDAQVLCREHKIVAVVERHVKLLFSLDQTNFKRNRHS